MSYIHYLSLSVSVVEYKYQLINLSETGVKEPMTNGSGKKESRPRDWDKIRMDPRIPIAYACFVVVTNVGLIVNERLMF